MFLRELHLLNFRNLADQQVAFSAPATLILGPNGQGKTSLLEAVFLLAHAKSFRTAHLRDVVRWTKQNEHAETNRLCAVEGLLETDIGSKRVRFELQRGKRTVYLNNNRVQSASAFYGQLSCVVFTPDELQLVKGPPAVRRRFIDRVIAGADPAYVEHLVSYQRALKNRNQLLQQQQPRPSASLLAPWDTLLAVHGREVAERRAAVLETLQPLFQRYYALMANAGAQQAGAEEERETVACALESDFYREGAVLTIEEAEAFYGGSHQRDLQYRMTAGGIHRDDLLLQIDSGYGLKDARRAASQGQSRSMALALKLASASYLLEASGEKPVLLLDDVESELDRHRAAALYRLVHAFGGQVIITGAQPSSIIEAELEGVAVLHLEAGKIISAIPT